MTNEENVLREELRAIMDRENISQTAIAKGVGLSVATVSQWLGHKYKGDTEKVRKAVTKFLRTFQERKERKATNVRTPGFIRTSVAGHITEVAKICHLDGEIGVAVGDAGIGKTTAVKKFAQDEAGVILIEADLGYIARVLFQVISAELGLEGVGTIHTLFEQAESKLQATGRLIIIDEAEHLPFKALELLRRLHDKAGVGVLLVGMPRLLGNLRGKRGEFAQLYSRVGVKAMLNCLRPTDTESFVQAYLPAANGIWKVFHDRTKGNARLLEKLIRRSSRLADINHVPIDAEVIDQALATLMI